MVLVVGGFGCAQGDEDVANRDTKAVQVGVLLPLSGSMAKSGNDVRVALEIAADDHPHAPIEFVFEDDQFHPAQSVHAFQQLIATKHVQVVVGPLNGSSIEAIRPLAHQHEILTITPWGAANHIDEFFLKNSVEVSDEVRLIVKTVMETLGYTKLGIMYMQNDFGLAHAHAFSKQVLQSGGEVVVSEPIKIGANDFRTPLLKMQKADVDMIYLVQNGAWNAKVTKQARELDMTIPFVGMYSTEASDTLAVAEGSMEGFIYSYTIDADNYSLKQRKFISEFEKRTNGRPQAAAFHAYDLYTSLLEAIEFCGDKKRAECWRAHIVENGMRDGVSGNFEYENNKIKRPLFMKQVMKGPFVMYPN